eukprot:GEZU01019449.1.p1 GENE.GEZU01019449.1~~GEZU01019449.1.p1  ORF type:complete len:102 (-),score=20.18 GEZU01019449.1:75-380(-)
MHDLAEETKDVFDRMVYAHIVYLVMLTTEVKPDTTPELHLRLILSNDHAGILREIFAARSQYDDDAVREYIREKISKLRREQRPMIAYDEAGDLIRGAWCA